MSYNSPINLFELSSPGEELVRQISKAIEDEKTTYVYEYVGHLGIDVDKEELLRALKYDRGQYQQGHFDGFFEGMQAAAAPSWIPTRERLPEEPGFYLATVMLDDPVADDGRAYGTVDIIYFTTAHTWADWDFADVTAWMPLPEPYENNSLDELRRLQRKIDEFNKKEEDT